MRLSVVGAWLALTAIGCNAGSTPMGPAAPGNGAATDDAGTSNGGAASISGVPCEVAQLLSEYCVSCHRDPPVSNTPMPLVSLDDLAADSPEGASYAALSLERMQSPTKPMPPTGKVPSSAAIAAYAAWLNAGMPGGTCDSVIDPFGGPSVCTSDEYWRGGNEESPHMHPGVACINCHTNGVADDGEREHGPRFSLAGTVFAGPHDPDDCNGVDGSEEQVVIEVVDANKKVVRMDALRSGNFYSKQAVTFPITARVLYQGRVREMLTPQTSGDCNSCHSKNGAMDAPGRILLP